MDDVDLHVHADLAFFTPGKAIRVPVPGPRSVKDAVEAAGIPHPEVDAVVVDGEVVGLSHVLRGGERVDVHPPLPGRSPRGGTRGDPGRSAAPHRFVCDVHLGRLARRLRLLGLDTWYRTDADDAELARVAVDDHRTLLTRDRGLMMRRVVVHAYCPRSDHPDEQTVEVIRRYRLQDRLQPMTRCTRCNGGLEPVDKASVLDEIPPRTRVEHDRFSRCAECGQVYWPGSHVGHIGAFVDRSLAAASPPAIGEPGG